MPTQPRYTLCMGKYTVHDVHRSVEDRSIWRRQANDKNDLRTNKTPSDVFKVSGTLDEWACGLSSVFFVLGTSGVG